MVVEPANNKKEAENCEQDTLEEHIEELSDIDGLTATIHYLFNRSETVRKVAKRVSVMLYYMQGEYDYAHMTLKDVPEYNPVDNERHVIQAESDGCYGSCESWGDDHIDTGTDAHEDTWDSLEVVAVSTSYRFFCRRVKLVNVQAYTPTTSNSSQVTLEVFMIVLSFHYVRLRRLALHYSVL
jgi:hypothetical protein